MKTAIVVLLVLSVMPYVMAGISNYLRKQQLGTLDNKHPRQQSSELTGVGARAVAAQQNCWEALGLYSAALLAVLLSGVQPVHLTEAALVVLVFRVLHAIFYLADSDKLRSLSFAVAAAPSFYLFYQALTNS